MKSNVQCTDVLMYMLFFQSRLSNSLDGTHEFHVGGVLWGQRSRLQLSFLCKHTVARSQHQRPAVVGIVQHCSVSFFKKKWAFCQHPSHIFTNNSTQHPKYTHTYTQMYSTVDAHINNKNTNSPLGSAQKFRSGRLDTENQETIGCQKGSLGLSQSHFPHSVPLLTGLLLRQLFYSPQKQLSIWFPLFLC